jgi:hypothetical protein
MNFCMANTQSKEEREEKERKKKNNFESNHVEPPYMPPIE